MTNEDALREALRYLADCLENDEVYMVNIDQIVRGEAARQELVKFARRIASNSTHWCEWCALKEKGSHVKQSKVSPADKPQY